MTVFKLIAKLLKFKGFRCAGLAFRRGNRLDVLVKPYKVSVQTRPFFPPGL